MGILGIDFGANKICMAIYNNNYSFKIFPSYILVDSAEGISNLDKKIYIGEEGLTHEGANSKLIYNIKRKLLTSNFELSTLLISQIFKKCKEKLESDNYEIIIAIPIDYSQKEKEILRKSCEGIGFKKINFLDEPLALILNKFEQLKQLLENQRIINILIVDIGDKSTRLYFFEISKIPSGKIDIKLKGYAIDNIGGDYYENCLLKQLEINKDISIKSKEEITNFKKILADSSDNQEIGFSYNNCQRTHPAQDWKILTSADMKVFINEKIYPLFESFRLKATDIDCFLLSGAIVKFQEIKSMIIRKFKIENEKIADINVINGIAYGAAKYLVDKQNSNMSEFLFSKKFSIGVEIKNNKIFSVISNEEIPKEHGKKIEKTSVFECEKKTSFSVNAFLTLFNKKEGSILIGSIPFNLAETNISNPMKIITIFNIEKKEEILAGKLKIFLPEINNIEKEIDLNFPSKEYNEEVLF